jgi:hypothetical protein
VPVMPISRPTTSFMALGLGVGNDLTATRRA